MNRIRIKTTALLAGLVVISIAFCDTSYADLIRVLTLDATRNFAGRGENFAGGSLYTEFKADLDNNANFGAGGTYGRDVNFLAPVASFNTTNLGLADVVIWSQRSAPDSMEQMALNSFVNGGGSLLVISQQVAPFIGYLGGTTTPSYGQPAYTGTYAAAQGGNPNPMTQGVFGDVSGFASNGGVASPGYYLNTSIGFSGRAGVVDSTTFAPNILTISATGTFGAGRVAIFGDDNLFFDTSYGSSAADRTAALNTFAWLADGSTAVPEPSSIFIFIVAGTAAASRRLMRSRKTAMV